MSQQPSWVGDIHRLRSFMSYQWSEKRRVKHARRNSIRPIVHWRWLSVDQRDRSLIYRRWLRASDSRLSAENEYLMGSMSGHCLTSPGNVKCYMIRENVIKCSIETDKCTEILHYFALVNCMCPLHSFARHTSNHYSVCTNFEVSTTLDAKMKYSVVIYINIPAAICVI